MHLFEGPLWVTHEKNCSIMNVVPLYVLIGAFRLSSFLYTP